MQPAVHFVRTALYLGGIISEAAVLARDALGRKFFSLFIACTGLMALYLGGIISEAAVLARKALGRKFFLSSLHALD